MASQNFDLLGVSADASADELRKAFRREALKWHPDKNPTRIHEATDRFKRIAQAYDALSSADRHCGGEEHSTAGFSDCRQGFCYQCAADPSARCSCKSGSSFSMESALTLFREIFGEDIRDVLRKLSGAAGHAACAAGSAAESFGFVALAAVVAMRNAGEAAASVIGSGPLAFAVCRKRKRKND